MGLSAGITFEGEAEIGLFSCPNEENSLYIPKRLLSELEDYCCRLEEELVLSRKADISVELGGLM